MRGFGIQDAWRRFLMRSPLCHSRNLLCTGSNKSSNKVAGGTAAAPSIRNFDAYRQLDKLDFMTAAKILFTTPPKTKKFGFDFHLVQLFFVCMPPLAVYLVAQYARYAIRRMEAEVEVKKKQEEEEKAKEMEAKALVELEAAKSNPELLLVKVRLEALEEAVKEIAVETKKQSIGSSTKAKGTTQTENIEWSKSENKSGDKSFAIGANRVGSQPCSSTDASTPFQSNEDQKAQGEIHATIQPGSSTDASTLFQGNEGQKAQGGGGYKT